MSELCLSIVLSTKPRQKVAGTDGQMTDAQDYVLSQADALTKKPRTFLDNGVFAKLPLLCKFFFPLKNTFLSRNIVFFNFGD